MNEKPRTLTVVSIGKSETCPAPGFLYFISSDEQGAVKIGFGTEPYMRLKTLQTGNPYELTLRAYVPATQEAEKAIHAELKGMRLRLEWYADDDFTWMLMDEIQAVCMERSVEAMADAEGGDLTALIDGMKTHVMTVADVMAAIAATKAFFAPVRSTTAMER